MTTKKNIADEYSYNDAHAEGWYLHSNRLSGVYEIRADKEINRFLSDMEAERFVRAVAGKSMSHAVAVLLAGQPIGAVKLGGFSDECAESDFEEYQKADRAYFDARNDYTSDRYDAKVLLRKVSHNAYMNRLTHARFYGEIGGYEVFTFRQSNGEGVRIMAGCRWFTIGEAYEHWGWTFAASAQADFPEEHDRVSERHISDDDRQRAHAMVKFLDMLCVIEGLPPYPVPGYLRRAIEVQEKHLAKVENDYSRLAYYVDDEEDED